MRIKFYNRMKLCLTGLLCLGTISLHGMVSKGVRKLCDKIQNDPYYISNSLVWVFVYGWQYETLDQAVPIPSESNFIQEDFAEDALNVLGEIDRKCKTEEDKMAIKNALEKRGEGLNIYKYRRIYIQPQEEFKQQISDWESPSIFGNKVAFFFEKEAYLPVQWKVFSEQEFHEWEQKIQNKE